MDRENVKEHFGHFQQPRILRVLVDNGQTYRAKLKKRAETMGIMTKDEKDLRFALAHWRLIEMEVSNEAHEEVIRLVDCKSQVAWLEGLLAAAVAHKEIETDVETRQV